MKKLLSLSFALVIFMSIIFSMPARTVNSAMSSTEVTVSEKSITSETASTQFQTVNNSELELKVKNTSNGIKLSWEKNGDNMFTVYRKTGNGEFSNLCTVNDKYTYTDTTVKSGNLYSYKLICGDESDIKEIMYLKAPKNFDFDAYESGVAYCSFSQVKGAKEYWLYQAKVSNKKTGKYKKIRTIEADEYIGDTEYSGRFFVLPKYTFKYVVKAVNGNYKSAFSKPKKFTNKVKPDVGVQMTKKYDGVRIEWNHIGADKYYVYKAKDKNKNFKRIATVKKVDVKDYSSYFSADCKYIDKKVKKGIKYYYYVVAKAGKKLIRQKGKTSKILFNNYDKLRKLKVGSSFTVDDYSEYKIVSGKASSINVTVKGDVESDFLNHKIKAVKKGTVIISFYGWFEYNDYWKRYKVVVE